MVAAVLALVAALALVASAREPVRAAQEGECADPGFVTDYNTFVLGDHRVINDSVDGSMAVGRDAFIQQFGVGNKLTPDATRVDLLVGRDIVSGGNARATNGAVTIRPESVGRAVGVRRDYQHSAAVRLLADVHHAALRSAVVGRPRAERNGHVARVLLQPDQLPRY